MVARWTIRLLKKLSPEKRLNFAANLFWFTAVAGTLSTIFVAHTPFERFLMALSWGAITITCIDIISTADVRDEQ